MTYIGLLLRVWIKVVDRGKPLREDAFSFTIMALFPPLNKRSICDKAKGLCI